MIPAPVIELQDYYRDICKRIGKAVTKGLSVNNIVVVDYSSLEKKHKIELRTETPWVAEFFDGELLEEVEPSDQYSAFLIYLDNEYIPKHERLQAKRDYIERVTKILVDHVNEIVQDQYREDDTKCIIMSIERLSGKKKMFWFRAKFWLVE
jgi:hypothetical protein